MATTTVDFPVELTTKYPYQPGSVKITSASAAQATLAFAEAMKALGAAAKPAAKIDLAAVTIFPTVPVTPVTPPGLDIDVYPAVLDLDVIASDIRNGRMGHAHECAVALAAGRRFDGAYVYVSGNGLTISEGERSASYQPADWYGFGNFIGCFDRNKAVKPTRFRMIRVA